MLFLSLLPPTTGSDAASWMNFSLTLLASLSFPLADNLQTLHSPLLSSGSGIYFSTSLNLDWHFALLWAIEVVAEASLTTHTCCFLKLGRKISISSKESLTISWDPSLNHFYRLITDAPAQTLSASFNPASSLQPAMALIMPLHCLKTPTVRLSPVLSDGEHGFSLQGSSLPFSSLNTSPEPAWLVSLQSSSNSPVPTTGVLTDPCLYTRCSLGVDAASPLTPAITLPAWWPLSLPSRFSNYTNY